MPDRAKGVATLSLYLGHLAFSAPLRLCAKPAWKD